jgi:hypothetical protein
MRSVLSLLTFTGLVVISHAADEWKSVSSQKPIQNGSGYSLINFKNNLIITGHFDSTKFNIQNPPPSLWTRNVAQWNGNEWSGLGRGVKSAFEVFATGIYKENLYVGGDRIDSAGEVKITNNVAMWNGKEWSAVGAGSKDIGIVYSFCEYKGELYIGGKLGLNKWDGVNWTNISISTTTNAIYSMKVYNDELYVAGTFTTLAGADFQNIAKYNGTVWSAVGGGLISNMKVGTTVINTAKVTSMGVFKGELYLAGAIDTAGNLDVNGMVRWNGTAWSDVSGGANSTVMAFVPHGSLLYISGYFWKVGTANLSSNRAATWNGTEWGALGSLSGGNAMAIRNDTLYGLGSQDLSMWSGKLEAIPTVLNQSAKPMLESRANITFASQQLLIRMVDFSGTVAELFDLKGRSVARAEILGSLSAMSLGHLPNGSYFVKLKSTWGTSVKSFTKY